MNAPVPQIDFANLADAEAILSDVVARMRAGAVIPYLGPGVTELAAPAVPMNPEALAAFLGAKVALPRRARGNAWAAAQHIESTRHRATVTALMAEAFATPVVPTALQRHLATLPLPLIVDSWYDGAMRSAFGERRDWGEIQGITRAGIGEDRWYRFYDAAGQEADRAEAKSWTTILYKPHGSVAPVKNFLITDADYVEVLTEIDIQTPIPDEVKARRTGRSFLFLGCRFNDQLLRTYARQVSKRSAESHYAVIEPDALSKNELRFLVSQGLTPLAIPLPRAIEIVQAG
ncbi:SIR2 family NAD-dependent protein deacylase [Bradyrhizobium amphicarpaeae]|uniref:SIR2 family protein n=1 Tax=Bradyrhizobium amphicarpaeae TaxID=1404768 RepID=A0A2U8Q369_9BRAD|nr:SIR2 family protein [Bradyrhizobium amphicarpaeae]AWM04432.1 SIR2 family protein [Bradyrhizobium amphicarpaeae]